MTSQSFSVLEMLFCSLGVISGAIGSYFGIRAAVKTQSEEDLLKKRFEVVWRTINIIPWNQLPEKAISWLLGKKTNITSWFANLGYKDGPVKLTFSFNAIAAGAAGWFLFGWIGVLTLGLPILFLLAIIASDINVKTWPTVVRILLWVGWLVPTTITLIVFLKLSTIVQLGVATVLTVTLIPVYAMAIFFLAVLVGGIRESQVENLNWQFEGNAFDYLVSFSIACAISFSVTLAALLIGHTAHSNAWVPQRIPMLLSNVLFDGLTLVVTLFILGLAIKPESCLSIPLAVILDAALAAVFACGSLWCGLRFTEHPVTLRETLNVLIIRSTNGSCWEIGPLFWAMHTTFGPTAVYLTVILLCWLAKFIYRPINWVFYRGKSSNPFGLTVALFSCVAAMLFGISMLMGHMEDRAKLSEIRPPVKSTVVTPKTN